MNLDSVSKTFCYSYCFFNTVHVLGIISNQYVSFLLCFCLSLRRSEDSIIIKKSICLLILVRVHISRGSISKAMRVCVCVWRGGGGGVDKTTLSDLVTGLIPVWRNYVFELQF